MEIVNISEAASKPTRCGNNATRTKHRKRMRKWLQLRMFDDKHFKEKLAFLFIVFVFEICCFFAVSRQRNGTHKTCGLWFVLINGCSLDGTRLKRLGFSSAFFCERVSFESQNWAPRLEKHHSEGAALMPTSHLVDQKPSAGMMSRALIHNDNNSTCHTD